MSSSRTSVTPKNFGARLPDLVDASPVIGSSAPKVSMAARTSELVTSGRRRACPSAGGRPGRRRRASLRSPAPKRSRSCARSPRFPSRRSRARPRAGRTRCRRAPRWRCRDRAARPRRGCAGWRPRPPRARDREAEAGQDHAHLGVAEVAGEQRDDRGEGGDERPPTSAQPAALRTLSRVTTAVISAAQGPTGGLPLSGQRQSRQGGQRGAGVGRGGGGDERLALALVRPSVSAYQG